MADADSIFKICSVCKQNKLLGDFPKRASRPCGVKSYCKTCNSARTKKWKAANPDKVKAERIRSAKTIAARISLWAKKNPGKIKDYNDKYRALNVKKLQDKNAKWRAENTEICKAGKKKWRLANLEKSRLSSHKRRTKIKGSGGVISEGISARLFKLQKGKCPCCSQPLGGDYQLDHIIPIALGGANVDSNIQLLRAICNRQKSFKHPIDFMQQRGFLL